jgi:formylglycine-generating enzyme required for sulfatase activity
MNPITLPTLIHDLGPAELRRLQREAAHAAGLEPFFQDRLRSGGLGPELAVIPPGRFLMGASDDGRRFGELERREVEVARPYAIGRHTVTAEEYAAYARAAGRVWPDHLIQSEGRQPVINITRLDAQGYLDWLSEETGRRYRLPSEREWEYAARAGSATDYCFGDRLSCGEANTASLVGTPRSGWLGWLPFCVPLHRVCEVGTYPANVWGLYEVHGNVWEFTADPWQGPLDPENSAAGDTGRWIVTKGGSWFEGVEDARFAARRPRMTTEMDTNLGLRVLRELDESPLP